MAPMLAAKIWRMPAPAPSELLERLRALAAAAPLLEQLGDADGVYVVGGAVRDLLLGGEPHELDLVVEGDAAALARRLGPAKVHDRFGTSTVTRDGLTYDFAQARTESYARPGALPDVEPATLEEDLERRDFTVNAMAIGLADGELRSVSQAPKDLDARLLRVLHDRSFIDDPTRLLRLARYAGRLGFAVEPGTRELVRAAVRDGALDTVTGPRIGNELRLLAREPNPIAVFGALRELGLDAAIHPGFGLDDPDLTRRALAMLPDDGRRDLLVLAAAARPIPRDELSALLDRFGFEARDRETIVNAAAGAETVARALAAAERPSAIAEAVGAGTPELVALAGALGGEDRAREWLERLRHIRLEIDGRDLAAAGIAEGPGVGRGLRAALADKLDGLTTGREDELARAVRAARVSG
jgi:tRNA nucleotidyltransferase (CCA-adding enzyme)